MNSIGLQELFKYIKENKIWLGQSISSGDREFQVPDSYPLDAATWRIDNNGNKFLRVKGVRWFTNIDHGRRHQPLQLMSMEDNLRFNKKLKKDIEKGKEPYIKYENYNAIEVPFTNAIPSDYKDIMGVPISFLDKYNPDQFEILGKCENMDYFNLKSKVYLKEECKKAYSDKFGKKGTYDLNASGVIYSNGLLEKVYTRILIKHRIKEK